MTYSYRKLDQPDDGHWPVFWIVEKYDDENNTMGYFYEAGIFHTEDEARTECVRLELTS